MEHIKQLMFRKLAKQVENLFKMKLLVFFLALLVTVTLVKSEPCSEPGSNSISLNPDCTCDKSRNLFKSYQHDVRGFICVYVPPSPPPPTPQPTNLCEYCGTGYYTKDPNCICPRDYRKTYEREERGWCCISYP